jgi:RNAse (barnase) inhibitor barstar
MKSQAEIIRELEDRISATEAICKDLLANVYNSEAQAQIKFDDYRIKYKKEAIEQREAEAKAKQLKENYITVKSEFTDRAKADYWTLVFLSDKQREKELDALWSSITTGVELPEDAKRPQHVIPELTEEQLFIRRVELQDSIDRANPTQNEHTIEHCSKSKIEFTNSSERERDRLIGELRARTDVSEPERQRLINEATQASKYRIQNHVNNMDRQINSAQASLSRLEKHKAELGRVKQALAKLLVKQ